MWDYVSTRVLPFRWRGGLAGVGSDQSGGDQDTWQARRRPIKRAPNKTKMSFFRGIRGTPVEEAAANRKKDGLFRRLIRQKVFNALFFRTVAWEDVDQWEKGGPFPSPNKTSGVRASLRCIKCTALNAALNETALHLMQRGFNLAVTRGHLPLTN